MRFFNVTVLFALLGYCFAGSIHPFLFEKVNAGGIHDVILELPSIIHKIEAFDHLEGDAKASAVVSALTHLTSTAQAPYVLVAKHLHIEYQQFWASNIVLLKSLDETTLHRFYSRINGHFTLREQHVVTIPSVTYNSSINTIKQTPQWGVVKVRAPQAWSITQGEGSVVATIDTGANLNHIALSPNFAGAWLDPYYNTALPTDEQGHGTFTLGVIVGAANGIGVAPKAKWISCRGMNHQGSGTESALISCAQFMVTATPRPHIVNTAFGPGSAWFDSSITAWRQVGIIPVFTGGGGSACGTIAWDSTQIIVVGRTDNTDALSNSGRGPSRSGEIKPDFAAPGVNIVSAGTGNNNYVTLSGTASESFVSGTIALVLSVNPQATFDQVLDLLRRTAYQPEISGHEDYCGPGPDNYPNNGYGYGIVDAGAALGIK